MRLCLTVGLLISLMHMASAQRIVLRTSTILDGKGGVLKNQQIVIEGSRIQSISSGNDAATYDLAA